MCGKALVATEDTRYVVKIEVYSAYDPLEVANPDADEGHAEEMQDFLADMEDMEAEELEDQVYRTFRFDLCPQCHAAYLKDPLLRASRLKSRFGHN